MRRLMVGAVALLGALSMGGAALAGDPKPPKVKVFVVDTCDFAFVNQCEFDGNITTSNVPEVDLAYNEEQDSGNFIPTQLIDLSAMDSASRDGNGSEDDGTQTSLFYVFFYAVKATNGFILYELDTPSLSFDWSTAGLPNGNSPNDPALSHLVWFGDDSFVPPTGGPVPEPATWAMMLMGFFGIGSALRSSRRRNAALA